MTHPKNDHDPIKALQEIRDHLRGARGRQHHLYACIYHEAGLIYRSPVHFERFKNEPFWVGVQFPDCFLLGVLRYASNAAATNTGDYKAAALAASALRYYFYKGVSADEVYELIQQEGGIGPLHQNQPPHSGKTSSSPPALPGSAQAPGHPANSASGAGPGGRVQTKGVVPAAAVRSQQERRHSKHTEPRRFTRAWCERHLCLAITAQELARILGLPQKARRKLMIEAEGPDADGFLVFRVVSA